MSMSLTLSPVVISPEEVALEALKAGISVLPVPANGTKFPGFLSRARDGETWEAYQHKRAGALQLQKWYQNMAGAGLCFICGAISGNLEALDFDNREYFDQFKLAAQQAGLAPLLERVTQGYLEQTPKGYHLLYRCTEPVEGNQKLALSGNQKNPQVLIETRGEGGLIVVAPSQGKVHPSQGAYQLISGGIETIVTILPHERQKLLNLARCFNQVEHNLKEAEANHFAYQTVVANGLRPGDDFNRRASWQEILEPHGWRAVGRFGSKTSWCRPGKSEGISATTDYQGLDGKLYVFSTSTAFEAEKAYNKFAAYTLLNHDGDYAAAATELASKGYGISSSAVVGSSINNGSLATTPNSSGKITSQNNTNTPDLKIVSKNVPFVPQPKIIPALELVAKEFEPTRWIVEEVLPEGLSMLAARPKIGKSWWALNVCLAVAGGGVALGNKPVEQGEVLYLALEDNERRMQKRINKLTPDGKVPAQLYLAFEWPRSEEGGCLALDGWLSQHPAARLLVIDTLVKFRKPQGKNENLYDADYNALQGLSKLAERYRIAIIVIHHTRKGQSEDPLEDISGSTGLTASLDNILTLRRKRGEASTLMHVIGRDIEGDKELVINFDQSSALWQLEGDAQEYAMSQERREVIQLLKAFPQGLKPVEIAKELGKNRDTVRQTLRRMYQEGQLNKDESDHYYPAVMSHSSHTVTDHSQQSTVVAQETGSDSPITTDTQSNSIEAEALSPAGTAAPAHNNALSVQKENATPVTPVTGVTPKVPIYSILPLTENTLAWVNRLTEYNGYAKMLLKQPTWEGVDDVLDRIKKAVPANHSDRTLLSKIATEYRARLFLDDCNDLPVN